MRRILRRAAERDRGKIPIQRQSREQASTHDVRKQKSARLITGRFLKV
jgi:hypothetical protein